LKQDCLRVTPGQTLNFLQKLGLQINANLHSKRDVIFAIDLTESVGLNDEGRIRLSQIIKDSLRSGDSVYIVPFATTVDPFAKKLNNLGALFIVDYQGKEEDIQKILAKVPFNAQQTLRQTDIQNAELFVYRGLGQINQCRLVENQAVRSQSIVWLTDAPLFTQVGIDSNLWKETPADSPFRQANSSPSQERQGWLKALPFQTRSQKIPTDGNKTYELSVVDLSPTVQEFCTPAPGGKETCLVNAYLLQQLWLPSLFLTVVLLSSGWGLKYFFSLRKKWTLRIDFPTELDRQTKKMFLANNQRIAIGDEALGTIYCPGDEIRGYLIRKGNKIYLQGKNTLPIYYQNKQAIELQEITKNILTINCPDSLNRDFEIKIKIDR
jgi:hypothetical protein